jgi:hypothetical protein
VGLMLYDNESGVSRGSWLPRTARRCPARRPLLGSPRVLR